MAISINTPGTWAFVASGSITVTLPTHATGNMLVVRVAYKSSAIATCLASTATPGWAKISTEFHNGTTNSGAGTGSVAVAAFWKIAASGAETNPQITFSQTVTQVGAVGISYQKAAAPETWDTPVGDGGGDTTSGTGVSATIQSNVSTKNGDLVDFFIGIADDTVMTVPTFTQTGVTFAAVSEQPATAGTVTSGDDMAFDGGYRLATAGISSAAAVVTGTLSTAETGSAWTTRLHVYIASSFTADAVIRTTVTPSLAADAVALRTQTLAFTVDATVSILHLPTFDADAVVKREITPTLAADAVIQTTASQSLTTDAIARALQSATFTGNAALRASAAAAFSADAVQLKTTTAGLSAEAMLATSRLDGYIADAVLLTPQESSFSADSVLQPSLVTHETSFATGAWVVILHWDFIVVTMTAPSISATMTTEATQVAANFTADALIV